MKLAERALGAAESRTLGLSAKVGRLRAAGVDVIGFLEGEPDLPVPEPVLKETARALASGRTRYSPAAGLPELRAALAKSLRAGGIPARPEGVLVTNGAKQAVYEALQVLAGPGDEAIVLAPYWVTFPEAVKLAGARPVVVENDGDLDVDAAGRAVTRKTRAIVVNSPNNPTGCVYSAESLKELARLAKKRDFMIVSDEAYDGLVYDGARHVSAASLGEAGAARTLAIRTFSKDYAMTGFRVGCACGPEALIAAMGRVHGHVTGNVCTFAQHGALAALALGEKHRAAWRAAHQKRRDLAFALASRLFDLEKPAGGLFLWADARRYMKRHGASEALAAYLLEKARVAVVPGSACGREGFLRLSFSASEKTIREGFARLEKAL